MHIAITGSSGLIGSELSSFLAGQNHHVTRIVRGTRKDADDIRWDPSSETIDAEALEGIDAVVHLAGENIGSGRWTPARKMRIRESRIGGTGFLARSLARLFDPPKVLVSVSAVGYYGNRGKELLNEESKPGDGFLAEVCRQWEAATQPAAMRDIRVVIPRVGMVLSSKGGALSTMLPFFRFGLGGKISGGDQYVSWIAIDDLVGVINHAIACETLQGPVNAVAPNPVTNIVFTRTLAGVLSRPALFALPSFAARAVFGEMANELLIAGARVSPARLTASGYTFKFPELEDALRHVLNQPKAEAPADK